MTKIQKNQLSTEINTSLDNADSSVQSTAWTPIWADRVIQVVSLTQAEYDAATKIATTFYIITD